MRPFVSFMHILLFVSFYQVSNAADSLMLSEHQWVYAVEDQSQQSSTTPCQSHASYCVEHFYYT